MTSSLTPLMNSLLSDFFTTFSDVADSHPTYPPSNIYVDSDEKLVFEFALAGFSPDDISISLEDNILYVEGKKQDVESERKYILKKIAQRSFKMKYILAQKYDFENVKSSFENGILKIIFPIKEEKKKKVIPISVVETKQLN